MKFVNPHTPRFALVPTYTLPFAIVGHVIFTYVPMLPAQIDVGKFAASYARIMLSFPISHNTPLVFPFAESDIPPTRSLKLKAAVPDGVVLKFVPLKAKALV